MSQLVDVGTWVALIAGIIGISLSVVAIWFAFGVDSRSRKVTEQMIQSLQKIESSVERSSVDTQGLIKVAWERMLGGVGLPPEKGTDEASEAAIEQVSAGLAEEVRAEMDAKRDDANIDEDRIVERVSEAIQAQLRAARPVATRSYERVEEWARTLSELSPTEYELVRFLANIGHLTRIQYNALLNEGPPFRSVLNTLRKAGILVPLAGAGEPKANQPVYWFQPNTTPDDLRIAFDLVSKDYPRERERLRKVLTDIGYLDEHGIERERGRRRIPGSADSQTVTNSATTEDSATTEESDSEDND
jgi:hypothetical protein